MATNLASTVNIGVHSACILRIATLDTDCSPLQGADGGIVTKGLVTLTATPNIEEGTAIEPKVACGDYAFRVEKPDRIKRYDLNGEIIFHDHELMTMLFGGSLVLGKAAGAFAGKVVGHAMPSSDTGLSSVGVYLEVIQLIAYEDVGECSPTTTGPYALGTIFGRVKAAPGDTTFAEDASSVMFTGKAMENPNLFDGPWNDYPGAGYIPRSPKVEVEYTLAQYQAIANVARAGYQALPVAS